MSQSQKIKLVQGDTRPQLVMVVSDDTTGEPINLSDPGTAVHLHFREVDSIALKATLVCGKLTGRLLPDGSIDNTPPYNLPGAGGRVYLDWTPDALDTPGAFQGELEVVFGDGTKQSVYELIAFTVREQLG